MVGVGGGGGEPALTHMYFYGFFQSTLKNVLAM